MNLSVIVRPVCVASPECYHKTLHRSRTLRLGEEIHLDVIYSPGNFSKIGGNMLRTCVHILIIHNEEGEIMKLVQGGR